VPKILSKTGVLKKRNSACILDTVKKRGPYRQHRYLYAYPSSSEADFRVISLRKKTYFVTLGRITDYSNRRRIETTVHFVKMSIRVCIIRDRYYAWNFPSPSVTECARYVSAVVVMRIGTSGHVTKMAVIPFPSAMSENPTPTLLNGSVFYRTIEPQLLPIEVLHSANRDFRSFFAPVTLTVTLIRWPSNTNLARIPSRCTRCAKMSILYVKVSKVIVWQTYRQTYGAEIIYHAVSLVVKKVTPQIMLLSSGVCC